MAKKKNEVAEELKHYSPHVIEAVEISARHDLSALLIGETGTGKTTLVREIAKREKKDLVRINLTGQTGVDDIVGRWIVAGGSMTWTDGLLTRAMRKGDWVVLDEINMALPEVLSKLHALMDEDRMIVLTEKDGEIVRPAEGFRLFATMNPSGDYAGTKEMNRALISRFHVVVEVPTAHDEAAMIVEKSAIDPETAGKLSEIGTKLREARKDGKISFAASTRDLLHAAFLLAQGVSFPHSVLLSIIGKAADEERNAVRGIVELITGESVAPAKTSRRTLAQVLEKAKQADALEKENKELKKKLIEASDKATKYDKIIRGVSEA